MSNLQNLMLVILPAISFLLMYFFSRRVKRNADLRHLPHIFSVFYLLFLCIGEVHEMIDGNFLRWFVIIVIFLVLVFLSKDRDLGLLKVLNHKNHVDFSNALAGLFVLHSVADSSVIATGHQNLFWAILLHRLLDGVLLFGLIYEKGLNYKNTVILSCFLILPIITMAIGVSFKDFPVLSNLFVIALSVNVVLDILSELNHSHGVKRYKVFLTVLLALLFSWLTIH